MTINNCIGIVNSYKKCTKKKNTKDKIQLKQIEFRQKKILLVYKNIVLTKTI